MPSISNDHHLRVLLLLLFLQFPQLHRTLPPHLPAAVPRDRTVPPTPAASRSPSPRHSTLTSPRESHIELLHRLRRLVQHRQLSREIARQQLVHDALQRRFRRVALQMEILRHCLQKRPAEIREHRAQLRHTSMKRPPDRSQTVVAPLTNFAPWRDFAGKRAPAAWTRRRFAAG